MTARLWDAISGEALAALEGHWSRIGYVAFSPDGKNILTVSSNNVRIWNAANGKAKLLLKGHSDIVWAASFSPDGKRIVTANEDDTARVWERRQTEYWWGVAWLPEFWLTVVLGGGLLVSVWRDR